MKLQDFPSSIEFRIKNESKVDEINIKVRNQTELNLVGRKSKVYRIEKIRIKPSFNSRALFESTRLVPEFRKISVARLVIIFAGSIQHYVTTFKMLQTLRTTNVTKPRNMFSAHFQMLNAIPSHPL